MVMEMTKTQTNIKHALLWIGVSVTIFGSSLILRKLRAREIQQDMARKEAICPALLSISRSARDTLIVMKAEDLCNSFVLDNLK